MVLNVNTIKRSADSTYKDLQSLENNIKLPANQYMNWDSVHICFPMKSKKFLAVVNNIDVNLIAVNNFFGHWVTEINIKGKRDVRKVQLCFKFFQLIHVFSI